MRGPFSEMSALAAALCPRFRARARQTGRTRAGRDSRRAETGIPVTELPLP
jgi:hypothetical protein